MASFEHSVSMSVLNSCFILTVGEIVVSIVGPDIAEAEVEHTFTCQANCTMECTTSWWFSHGFPSGLSVLGDTIHWTPIESGFEQEFECYAENDLAQRSVRTTKKVTVPGESLFFFRNDMVHIV